MVLLRQLTRIVALDVDNTAHRVTADGDVNDCSFIDTGYEGLEEETSCLHSLHHFRRHEKHS